MNYKQKWRQKARRLLAEAFGGKCAVCGYDKSIAALDYHHVNPGEKDHSLYKAMRNGYAWSKIVEEARKCALVCCRCHREIHAGITELPENYTRFNEEYSDLIKIKKKEFDSCPVCNKMKNLLNSFCSVECSQKNQQRFSITKSELEKLVAEFSYEEIGRRFGVSGNAIKKRCKSFGIVLAPRKMRV